MHLHRRDLLRTLTATGFLGLPGLARSSTPPMKLVVVIADGGWDVTYCMDPKLGEPEIEGPEREEDPRDPDDREAVRTFSGLPIMVNDVKRPQVTQFFEEWGSRTAVINGLWLGTLAHDPCRERILSGSTLGTVPDMSVIAGYAHGQDLPLGSVDMSGLGQGGRYASSVGRVGYRSQLAMLLDSDAVFEPPRGVDWAYPQYRNTDADDVAIREIIRSRAERFRTRRGDGGHNDRLLDDFGISLERAERFAAERGLITEALELGSFPSLMTSTSLAVDFLSVGLCHSVLIDTSMRWDTHTDNFAQHSNYDLTFRGLNNLVTRLDDEGLLDETLVVVLSEMTRTPKFNASGGKDHWPYTSALMLGGGVVGGRVRGGTDGLLASRPVDLATGELSGAGSIIKYDNLAAGVLQMIGVDSEEWLPGIPPFMGATV